MKAALAAAALVVAANAVTILAVKHERDAGPVRVVTIPICEGQLIGGPGSDMAPALRLTLATDGTDTIPGLDTAGLHALGLPAPFIAQVGRTRSDSFRFPVERPARIRLRAGEDSLHALVVAEVRPRREDLAADSTSFVLRALVGGRERHAEATAAGHDHGAPVRYTPGIIYPAVLEVIPARLHLSAGRIAALRAARSDTTACGGTRTVQVANGAQGGVWVE